LPPKEVIASITAKIAVVRATRLVKAFPLISSSSSIFGSSTSAIVLLLLFVFTPPFPKETRNRKAGMLEKFYSDNIIPLFNEFFKTIRMGGRVDSGCGQ
jgi:hypothetical protein